MTPENNNTPTTSADGVCNSLVCSPHALLDARKDSCAWIDDDDGNPETECGEHYVYEEGWRDHVRFCQGCGGVVIII